MQMGKTQESTGVTVHISGSARTLVWASQFGMSAVQWENSNKTSQQTPIDCKTKNDLLLYIK